MIKILLLLLFPLFLFSKYQVVTYFPLESNIVKKIAQNEVKIREITNRFVPIYRELPYSEASRLSNAKIYFHFGLDVEKAYGNVLRERNPELVEIDLSEGIQKLPTNPYFWTDPFILRDVAKKIYETLVFYDKYQAEYYKNNYEKFLEELDETFLKIKRKLASSDVYAVYVYDDYWEYFANRFRIKTFKRPKEHINITEIDNLVEFKNKENITRILFFDEKDHNVVFSLANNLNIKAVEDNIFNDNWQINLLELANNLNK
ncbi:MAG: zinc ABC transporter substrate-binding protein [Arcobacter sp.]|nr:zinc ABC transporter substrate-binding protein [Arcobacter sp.]